VLRVRVEVRELSEGDAAGWRPLWDGYNAFYGRSGETALPDEVVRTTWQRILDPSEPVHGLVAVLEGEVVGIAHFLFHRSTIHIEPSCYLQDLFTAEAARGHGVGGALIEQVARRATSAGAARLYWHTHESNATARRLYDRVAEPSGFVVYRRPC
jgi:GNAT superfamily N-acetyltransferase